MAPIFSRTAHRKNKTEYVAKIYQHLIKIQTTINIKWKGYNVEIGLVSIMKFCSLIQKAPLALNPAVAGVSVFKLQEE